LSQTPTRGSPECAPSIYSGETLETLAVGSEAIAAVERIAGVPMRSYGALSVKYFFGR
jgi:hypothetical protein